MLPYGSGHLHQDSKAKIVASYDALGVGPVGLVGKIGGAGANLEMRLHSGAVVTELVTDGAMQFGVNRKDKLLLTFDANTGALTGTDRVSRTREEVEYGSPGSFWESDHTYIKRTTSVSVQSVAMKVPASTDGNWTLSLEIVPGENKLSGTAAITFSNGDIFRFQVLGRYSPKTGKTILLLKGSGADKGANLSLSFSGPDMEIESIRGAVGGQRIRFPQA